MVKQFSKYYSETYIHIQNYSHFFTNPGTHKNKDSAVLDSQVHFYIIIS